MDSIEDADSYETCKASYNDISIQFNDSRHSFINMPYDVVLQCTRAGGWELWQGRTKLLAGEYDTTKLKIFFKDIMICGKYEKDYKPLTDEECDAFRRLPYGFNDMVRAIYNAGRNSVLMEKI